MSVRSGIGFDTHPLVKGRPLVLGGVIVPFEKGLKGHSDGDVLIHAIIDAILGAAGAGDIGSHFPSSDPGYRSIESTKLGANTINLVAELGWRLTYVDATIIAQRPMLSSLIDTFKEVLSSSLGVDRDQVNIKAKTTDGLGFTGRGEGIAALAVATLESTK